MKSLFLTLCILLSTQSMAQANDSCNVYTTPSGESFACCLDPKTGKLVCDPEDEAINECIVEWAQSEGCSTDLCCELIHGGE